MSVEVRNESGVQADETLFARVFAQVLADEEFSLPAYMFLLLTDDGRIHAVNRETRGVDCATDVLSFPSFAPGERIGRRDIDPGTGEVFLGDVLISVVRAQAQAKEYGHDLTRELAYLTVHASLHLLGYDHETDEERAVMRAKEEKTLGALGLTR